MKYSKPTQRLVGDTYLTSRRDKAVVDGRYSSIIMAKSLTGDKDVLTVEPGIENSSNKMQKNENEGPEQHVGDDHWLEH